jgi:dienelactone hydrolase
MRFLFVALFLVHGALAAAAAEKVDIPRAGGVLHGTLFRPKGDAPAPAVVALHGCGGVTDSKGRMRAQYREWAEHLTAAGFVVLYPDSFGSRGLGNQCRVKNRSVRVSRERVADANAARVWLQGQSFVRPDRVYLLGWSNGGSSTLWTVRPQAAPKDGHPDFRAAVAFYPGCRTPTEAAWSARIPILILIGAADDWTPARYCDRMVAEASGRSALATLVKYDGAYHSFDHANLPLRELNGLAFSGDGTGHVHVGTNAAARADAYRRVPEWFAR